MNDLTAMSTEALTRWLASTEANVAAMSRGGSSRGLAGNMQLARNIRAELARRA